MKTITELQRLDSFESRFEYLSLRSLVGDRTFGGERYLNQDFYRSREWKNARYDVIARDEGCDLGAEGYEIHERIIVHHMNPITPQDVIRGNPDILNPDYLITVSHKTHNAIHYGGPAPVARPLVVRRPGDTNEW